MQTIVDFHISEGKKRVKKASMFQVCTSFDIFVPAIDIFIELWVQNVTKQPFALNTRAQAAVSSYLG